MRNLILLLLIISVISLFADSRKQTGEYYEHLFEQAHPSLPNKYVINEKILVPRKQSGFSFFENKNLIDTEVDPNQPQNESSIAVNPLNPKNLIASAVDYRNASSTWVYVSNDGGYTWENYSLGKPDNDWRSTNDPSVAYDPDGVGYLVYGGFGERTDINGVLSGENGVFLARTIDQGETWDAHKVVIIHEGQQSEDSTFEDKYYISIDNSPSSPYYKHLYIPWKRVTPKDSATQIVLTKSTDKGDSWSTPVPVSDRLAGSSEDTTFGQSFPLAAAGPDGTVYVVWNHGVEHGVGFNRSDDGGATFGDPRIIHHYDIFGETRDISSDESGIYRHTVKGAVRAEAYPIIVVDTLGEDRNGWVYVCWAADNPPNVYFSRSTDKGDNWSEPKIVHSTDKNDQFWAWMSIDPKSGNLAIMYFDSRNYDDNDLVECYVSLSTDGGDTWIDRQVSDIGHDLTLNPFSMRSFAGDYSGLAFYDGFIYPSWVDMRNSEIILSDNDVYTAVVNTEAPLPIENLKASTIPEDPFALDLTWDLPEKLELAFGQAVSSDQLKINIFRENEFIAELEFETSEYRDEGLEEFSEYKYRAVVVKDNDTSASRTVLGYSGGARQPSSPKILNANGNDDLSVDIEVEVPATRKDGTTPLVDLSGLNLYRDSKFIRKIELEVTDTSKIITVSDQPEERGFYKYYITAVDSFEPENESDTSSNTLVYTGQIEDFFLDNFSEDQLRKYYISEGWAISSEYYKSAPYSLHESINGNYESRKEYVLMIFPVTESEIQSNTMELRFSHSAKLKPNDIGIIEYSEDMENWTVIKEFKDDSYPEWEDEIFDENDWFDESIQLQDRSSTGIGYFRFRLSTNSFLEDDGWYLDNIAVNNVYLSVNEIESENEIMIYPNPAHEKITLKGLITGASIRIFNNMGVEIQNFKILKSDINTTIDVSDLSTGVYFIETSKGRGKNRLIPFIKN